LNFVVILYLARHLNRTRQAMPTAWRTPLRLANRHRPPMGIHWMRHGIGPGVKPWSPRTTSSSRLLPATLPNVVG